MRARVAELVPVTGKLGLRRSWAATIDFTPDHLPILGPLLTADGPVDGAVVAAAGGHGMMWGPAVSRVAADLVAHGPHRRRRRHRPRSRPLRRRRAQQARARPHRPAVPREDLT